MRSLAPWMLMLLLGGRAPAAEAPATVRLDLTEAVRLARESSPAMKSLAQDRIAAGHELDAARAERYPWVDGVAGYTRRSSVPELTLPINGVDRTIFPDLRNNWIARVEATVPIYTGGRTDATIRAAEGRRDAATAEERIGDDDLVFEVRQTYWSLVTALETVRVLRQAQASFDAHLDDARNRERFGVAAANEVLAVKVERDRAELARLHAENLAATIGADLIRLTGLPPGSRIVPTEPLTGAGDADPADRVDVEDRVAEALRSRSERTALTARIAEAEAAERARRSARRPQLAFAAGYDVARPNRDIVPPEDRWDDTWDLSMQLSIRLGDGGRTAAAVAGAEARTEALRLRRDDLDRRIRRDVVARSLELESALLAIEVAETNVASADENLRIARERYREGVIPSSELLDAETARLDAGLDRTRTLATARQARAALDRAVGD